ncbi:MAG TPA: type II toxin-antitoxin system ParD family antitoxin [Pirellulaceae bacterium]|nr:type II toxin-antitoxin system ParD family antitoxin [Pirellulaceae bacterium]
MTIKLPAEIEAIVKAKVASGAYASESDVVVAALRLLESDAERQRKFAELKALIQEGIDSAERGELYDGEEVFDEILRELDEAEQQES